MQLGILPVRIILDAMVVSAIVVIAQLASARFMEIFFQALPFLAFPVSRSPHPLSPGFQTASLDSVVCSNVSFPMLCRDRGGVDEETEKGTEDDGGLPESHSVLHIPGKLYDAKESKLLARM